MAYGDRLALGARCADHLPAPRRRHRDATHPSAECIDGTVEIELIYEAVFDYGRTPAAWELVDDEHLAQTTGAGVMMRLRSDLMLGIEGDRVRGRHVLEEGENPFCVYSWRDDGYTWIRDSTFTVQALHWLTMDWEADEFMQFIADLQPSDDGSLQIMYGIDGRRELGESILDRQRRLRKHRMRRTLRRCVAARNHAHARFRRRHVPRRLLGCEHLHRYRPAVRSSTRSDDSVAIDDPKVPPSQHREN
jgi:hypothetical protein